MRTVNKHPQWHDQPLRLTNEQKENPAPVFIDFFQCFHLNEVREILWHWMVEVISSKHSISNDPNERSNHIFFYEKMETLVEAAFIIDKKIRKFQRKKKNKKKKHKSKTEP